MPRRARRPLTIRPRLTPVRASILVGLASILFPSPPASVDAQDPPPELVTDRPDRTESAVTVPQGFVQLEVGGLYSTETSGDGELEVLEGPGTLVRLGLGHRLELRIGWSGFVEEHFEPRTGGGSTDLDGIGDGEVGAKLRLWEETGPRPQAALLAAVNVPVGDESLSSERYEPTLLLALARTLSERLSLGVNLGAVWETEEITPDRRETLSDFVYSAALGISITERLGAFVEVFGAEPLETGGPGGAPGDSAVSIDGGFTWLLRPNVQLDLSAGGGLTDEAPDWFAGAGLSVRWPR